MFTIFCVSCATRKLISFIDFITQILATADSVNWPILKQSYSFFSHHQSILSNASSSISLFMWRTREEKKKTKRKCPFNWNRLRFSYALHQTTHLDFTKLSWQRAPYTRAKAKGKWSKCTKLIHTLSLMGFCTIETTFETQLETMIYSKCWFSSFIFSIVFGFRCGFVASIA